MARRDPMVYGKFDDPGAAGRLSWRAYAAFGALLLSMTVGGVILGGPLAELMLTGLQIIPFAVLAVLSYLGVRRSWARALALGWLALLLLSMGGVALLFAFGAMFAGVGLVPGSSPAGIPALPPGALAQLGGIALSTVAGLGVAGLLLAPAARRRLARVLPIDPDSWVHATALALVVGATVINFGQLAALDGMPPMLALVEGTSGLATGSATEDLLRIVYGFVWMAPGAIVAVGYPVARSFRGAIARLGLARPQFGQILAAIGGALLMVAGALVLDTGINQVWSALGWPRTDSAAFEQLLGAAISPVGAVLIGVTAGLGEEMVIRGALQPRLGILLSNLFFTSLHAFQYSFDGLLSVFLVGSVLGLVRARSNTTISSIMHGVYNFTLVMISALSLFQ